MILDFNRISTDQFLIFICLLQNISRVASSSHAIVRCVTWLVTLSYISLHVCFHTLITGSSVGYTEQRRWSLIIMQRCRLVPETVIPRADGMAHAAPISVFHHCRHLWALFVGRRRVALCWSLALCPNVSTIRLGSDATDALAADTISFTFLPPEGAISPPETVAREWGSRFNAICGRLGLNGHMRHR